MLKYMALETGQGNTAAVQKYDALYRQRFGEGMDYWLRRDRTELSVMMLAKRVIDSPALLRKLGLRGRVWVILGHFRGAAAWT